MARKIGLLFAIMITSLDAAQWIRMASPHFEIHTDMGESRARRVLTRFEQARKVLSDSAWWHDAGQLPLLVLLFGSERDFSALRANATVRGFYQSGPDRDYIAMSGGADLDRIVLHEYTHSVLNHSAAPLPQWFEEGLAELYSTLEFGAREARVGGAIEEHVAALNRREWFTGGELARIDQESPHYNEAGKVGLFYAQSWALTHMLTFAKGYREALPDYVEMLTAGDDPASAFQRAFGKGLDAALGDLRTYSRLRFSGVTIGVSLSEVPAVTKAEVLDPSVALQSRAELLLLMRRDEEAGRIYEQAAKRYPNSPATYSGLAVLAVRKRDFGAARKLFEQAMALGARDGGTYFEYAMLLRHTGAAQAEVNEYLQKAVAANPGHAEAHFLLGVRASDAGRFSDAVRHLARAAELLPRQAYFWQALTFAHHKLGQRDQARTAALRALRAARTEHEEQMARSALNLVEAVEPQLPQPAPSVRTPESWSDPKGDAAFLGELVNVDCMSRPVRLHLRGTAGPLILLVGDPKKVAIRGGPLQTSLTCGVQKPVPVRVEYFTSSSQVAAIEFR